MAKRNILSNEFSILKLINVHSLAPRGRVYSKTLKHMRKKHLQIEIRNILSSKKLKTATKKNKQKKHTHSQTFAIKAHLWHRLIYHNVSIAIS